MANAGLMQTPTEQDFNREQAFTVTKGTNISIFRLAVGTKVILDLAHFTISPRFGNGIGGHGTSWESIAVK